ncbi:MAG: metallophosphoesterase [Lachnospiraceae bacterium]|nr:metallophosphoesterase [Lachnospiraceae bacterium]
MMRVLIVSDSHGAWEQLEKVVAKEQGITQLIHCGDICGDANRLRGLAGRVYGLTDGDVHVVRGNCDGSSAGLLEEEIILLGSKKILVTHGHRYHVNWGRELLAKEAATIGMDAVFYGHTHVPEWCELEGVFVGNPGSVALPRQADRRCSYGILTLTEKGELEYTQKYLD